MTDTIVSLFKETMLWKEKYGQVYRIDISNLSYIFRPLSKSEHETIIASRILDPGLYEDILLSICLLHPKFDSLQFDEKLAGDVKALTDAIVKISGFSDPDRLIEDIDAARKSLESLDNQIISVICKAFPSITLQDIGKFTYDDIIKYLVLSESILDVKLNIEKPENHQGGKIDFEKENRSVGSRGPFAVLPTNPQTKRGVSSK